MADGDNAPQQREEFKRQTPATYKWAMGATGLVAAATTATLTIKPEAAGYSLSALILFIMLIFVVLSIELGTTSVDLTNPLARNAQLQVQVLSWFATLAFIVGAAAIMSSILIRWPLDMALNEDKTTNKYLESIKRYDLPKSFIERSSARGQWVERSNIDSSAVYSFTEDDFNPIYLLLSDAGRSVKVRIATQGGLVEWSLNEKFKDCDTQYCWGDVGQAKMRR